MADDIRSRAGLDPREEAARRIRDGQARRAAAREALTQEQMRERTMREMAERRAARNAAPPAAAPERTPVQTRSAAAPAAPAAGAANPPARGAAPPSIPTQIGQGAAMGVRAASRLLPGYAAVAGMRPTSLAEGARYEREELPRAREEALRAQEAERIPPPPPPAPPVPAARPRPRPAAAAPSEISAQRLNELADGAEPTNVQESVIQMRMRNRRRELEETGTAFKKGGMVKPKAKPVAKKAGGMIAKPKAAPKKMMKGGAVAKPKVAVKSKGKPMPFKKGGVIKKGRK